MCGVLSTSLIELETTPVLDLCRCWSTSLNSVSEKAEMGRRIVQELVIKSPVVPQDPFTVSELKLSYMDTPR
jgi:hypothetical protein